MGIYCFNVKLCANMFLEQSLSFLWLPNISFIYDSFPSFSSLQRKMQRFFIFIGLAFSEKNLQKCFQEKIGLWQKKSWLSAPFERREFTKRKYFIIFKLFMLQKWLIIVYSFNNVSSSTLPFSSTFTPWYLLSSGS